MASTQTPHLLTANTLSKAESSQNVEEIKDANNETFVTQRGGKIVQGTPLYVPLVTQNEKQAPSIFDNRHTLQSTLSSRRRKMNLVQANLEKKRAEFSKRMEECREKQEELRVKQKQIRDRVTKFEKFLKENDAKRQRANVKAMTEKKMQKYQIYERYLQSVVDVFLLITLTSMNPM
ncbi:hypothetical protein BCR33DRAFT_810483 [Rhizoclosmatium globosum]|uniref:DUF4200 domain-containing protein n=1 Tax=Rhizoclosmatium globosum TaxID=329046 RepID=A0A1Y2CHY4_9FUNG|nr:hypothetical protein BCR33DRAFT_810483 [Rhizoclosmatium globosum]|eukprot:ORY46546.1 hypothetical protein BCR33DRAFT_810483 [Rhizoclosmatium globosum]